MNLSRGVQRLADSIGNFIRRIRQTAGDSTVPLSQLSRRFDTMLARERGYDGTSMTPGLAYQQSAWVYGAVKLIASTVANTPFLAVNEAGDPLPGSRMQKLIDRPSTYEQQDSSTKARTAYFTELLLNGAVMRAFTAMEGDIPTSMYIYPRWWFSPETEVDDNGLNVVRRWRMSRWNNKSFIPGDTIYHDALYNPFHDFEGLSPLQAAMLMVSNDVGCSLFTNRFFANDASSGLILSTEDPNFDADAAKQAQKVFDDRRAGAAKAFGTLFLGHGLKPHIVGKPFDADAQSIIKSLTKDEIVSGVYGIPGEIFGTTDRGGGGVVIGARTKEPAYEGFLVNVIQPWANFHDDEWNKDVAWRFSSREFGRHDFSQNPTLENRRLERAQIAATLLDRGVPLNEAIRWLKLSIKPQPHGDDWWAPNWMVPASVIQENAEKVYTDSGGSAKQSLDAYVASIVDRASQVSTRTQAVEKETIALNGRKPKNVNRIAEIIANEF